MHNRTHCFVSLASIALGCLFLRPAAAQYSIVDIGAGANLAGFSNAGFGLAVNNKGQVAGVITHTPVPINGHIYTTYFEQAFRWSGGALTLLPIQSGDMSAAYGINSTGQVVGYKNDRGFLWQGNTVTLLPSFDPQNQNGFSIATAINDAGQVTGQATELPSNGFPRAFLWENSGPLQELSGGSFRGANAINSAGNLAGYDHPHVGGSDQVIFYNGSVNNVGSGSAAAINDNNQIAGTGSDIHGLPFAFLGQNGALTDLGFRFAYGINNSGVVVGEGGSVSDPKGAGDKRAYIWKNGTLTDLNTLLPANSGWKVVSARAISNTGFIVGTGFFQSQQHAFLMYVAPRLNGLTCPAKIAGGRRDAGVVRLSDITPMPVTVALSSDNPALTVPSHVVISAGSSVASFGIITSQVFAPTLVTVTAKLGSVTRTAQVVVMP